MLILVAGEDASSAWEPRQGGAERTKLNHIIMPNACKVNPVLDAVPKDPLSPEMKPNNDRSIGEFSIYINS